jgi:HEPN domain-containing protein
MHTDLLLNDFAIRCFRDEGDSDYISARMAFRAGITTSLWASQQMLEKYVKCILLLNRIPGKNVMHDLRKGLDLIDASNKIQLDLTPNTQRFIDYIDTNGQHRYLEKSRFFDSSNIVNLDRAAWELRRFCALDPAPKLLKLVQGITTPKFKLAGGYLESIIDDEKSPAREPLLWRNFFFGRRQRRYWKKPKFRFRVSNAPLHMHPEILEEVLKYVYLPNRLILEYRAYAKSR